MTDVDRMTEEELRLRAELRETLVPPPVPAALRASVEGLAEDKAAGHARTRRWWGEILGMGTRRSSVAAGAVAVLGLAVLGGLVLSSRGDGTVAATPAPTPPAATQPAATQPLATLPDPDGTGRTGHSVVDGAWIDASSAWAVTFDSRAEPLAPRVLWMTADGGQTWSQRGPMPSIESPTFFDALHGYQPGAVVPAGSGYAFQVNLTTDGGRSWHAATAATLSRRSWHAATAGTPSADLSFEPVSTSHFTDPLRGVVLVTIFDTDVLEGQRRPTVACEGWSTDDGGQTWATIADAPCWSAPTLWASPSVGAMVSSDDGATSVTSDGGRHWTAGALPATGGSGRFRSLLVVEPRPGTVRIVGYYWTGNEEGNEPAPDPLVVLETRDGGASWQELYRSTAVDAYRVRTISGLGTDHWLAAIPDGGDTAISETEDGGRSWTPAGWTLNFGADGVSWLDRLHGAARGQQAAVCPEPDTCTVRSTVLFTNDGGRSWHEVPS